MYVTGIGRTKFGTLTDTMPELIYQAMYNAIIDSPTLIEEIIPALYRGTKVNPRPYNVSCTENVYVEIKDEDVIFGVELSNLEVSTVSNR
jgi:hypothetical protein